ncbi:MAG: biotin/lipoyl-binding protein [Acidobacteriaceae bacterium]|nr:biotin/lipoyl-binding protein [Acidobacteriaceae bacterium]MBV8569190.1 biotin/lipoyl-binding protein [Acidobacteriaceae bacterium]
MKYIVAVDDLEYVLELQCGKDSVTYQLKGDVQVSGSASVTEVGPGVFSVLLDSRSITVYLVRNGSGVETWTGTDHRLIAVSDARDRSGKARTAGTAGPFEVKAQMPGKVIKLLVSAGQKVETGQGLLVIEAMKMQNETKSRKTGTVTTIRAREGSTVSAGESLMVIE